MPQLSPKKRAQVAAWLGDFANQFARTTKGIQHAAQYDANRANGRRFFDEARKRVKAGDDATDYILSHLLPHANTAPNRSRDVWIHIAPCITKDLKEWFEGAEWARAEDWPAIARLLFEFFESCEREPKRIAEWCERFRSNPLRKGFKAAFLSPMLNALHPEQFAIVNKKPLLLLGWCYDETFTASIESYPAVSAMLMTLAEELRPELERAAAPRQNPRDALDMFTHWLVSTKRLGASDDDESADETGSAAAIAEDPPSDKLWLIAAGRGGNDWPLFQNEPCIAIDYSGTDDLRNYPSRETMTEALRTLATEENDTDPTNHSLACWEFSRTMKPGDRVMAKGGTGRILGVGIVTGEYEFVAKAASFKHRRAVRWLKIGPWQIPAANLPIKTLTKVVDADFRAALEKATSATTAPATVMEFSAYTLEQATAELFMQPQKISQALALLRERLNLVLQGPPGVGKTFAARRIACLLLGAEDTSRMEIVQFHPSTSYEDFVLGLRPDGQGGFVLKPGVFHRFCQRAQADASRPYVFIIDEINRGNLARIFGELLLLLETDKRGEKHAVPLAYSGDGDERFYLPPNLHVIGTMNTADRSLALVDYALRRRFAFVTLEPDFGAAFRSELARHNRSPAVIDKICARMAELNVTICAETRSLGRGYQIGHSFFCRRNGSPDSEAWYRSIVLHELQPLLEEYWVDEPSRAAAEVAKLLA